jgi:hypothetical protein
LKSTRPTEKRKKIKWIRRILLFVSGLIVLALLALLLSKPWIERKINSQLKALEPEIQIKYAALHLSLFSSSIGLDSLSIQLRPNSNDKYSHSIYVDQVRLEGVHLFALLRGKEFIAERLKIGKSNIHLDDFLIQKNEVLPPGLASRLGFSFRKITIHRIECGRASLSLDSGKQILLNLEAEVQLSGLSILDLQDSFSSQNLNFTSMSGTLFDIRYPIPGTLHSLQIKALNFNSDKKSVSVNSLELIPQYDKWDIAARLGYQANYVHVLVPSIEMNNIDWSAARNKIFRAGKVNLGKVSAYIFRDRRVNRRSVNQPLPGDYLNKLPYDLRIASLQVGPAEIIYEEFPAKGKKTGILKIEHLRLSIAPLINHPGKEDPQQVRSEVSGAVMGSGDMNASITMPLKSNGNYTVQGEFNNLDLTKLNSSAENLGQFHIESGILNHLTFDFHFNDEKSIGQVVGEYHNLVVDKLRGDEKHLGQKDKFKSFFVQKFIIPKNKDKSLPVSRRSGKIDYKYDPTRFISFYLLKSLLSGVKASFNLGFLLPG